jgi:(heptosyl)LPS beta-1,4-glucosyltransferase
MSFHKLSATIITLNEERNIERCLNHLLPICDEIIVVDSYSSDRTKEICEQKNVRFIQTEWNGYAATKNYANSLAKHEYILSIDADEAPDKELQQSILKIKEQGFQGVYSVNRLTNYCGKWIYHSGWYPDWKIRIFPKSLTKWTGEFVHEELLFSEDLKNDSLEGHLSHYSYYNFKEHRERADHYSVLTAKKLFAQNKKANFAKPFLSAVGRFIAMYIIKKGFLDGAMGWKIAKISAASNFLKYKTLNELHRVKKD